jgi:hypothetical protein
MVLKTKDIKSNLCRKGFIEDNKDHKYFYFCHHGKPAAIRTKFSHSANEVDDHLIAWGLIPRPLGRLKKERK